MKHQETSFDHHVEEIKNAYANEIFADPEGKDIVIPDPTEILKKLTLEIRGSNRNYDQQRFLSAISALDAKIAKVPTTMTVRHHLAAWSKGYVIVAITAFCITSVSIYLAIRFHSENQYLQQEVRKYQYVELLYPEVSGLINYEILYDQERLNHRVTDSRKKTALSNKQKQSRRKSNLKTNEK